MGFFEVRSSAHEASLTLDGESKFLAEVLPPAENRVRVPAVESFCSSLDTLYSVKTL